MFNRALALLILFPAIACGESVTTRTNIHGINCNHIEVYDIQGRLLRGGLQLNDFIQPIQDFDDPIMRQLKISVQSSKVPVQTYIGAKIAIESDNIAVSDFSPHTVFPVSDIPVIHEVVNE